MPGGALCDRLRIAGVPDGNVFCGQTFKPVSPLQGEMSELEGEIHCPVCRVNLENVNA